MDATLAYANGSYRGRTDVWQGSASVATTSDTTYIAGATVDSVYISLSLRNSSGGDSGAAFATRLRNDGSFEWSDDHGKTRFSGRLNGGRLDGEWYDERENGAIFHGSVVGKRR